MAERDTSPCTRCGKPRTAIRDYIRSSMCYACRTAVAHELMNEMGLTVATANAMARGGAIKRDWREAMTADFQYTPGLGKVRYAEIDRAKARLAASVSTTDGETLLWNFHCTASRLADGRYRVSLITASGRAIERTGYHPLHELIRIIGNAQSTPIGKEAENDIQKPHP